MMSKLNRAFSRKEIALILFLTLVLLGLVYYRLVRMPLTEEIRSYDTTEIEMQIELETAKAAQIKRMKNEIASGLKKYNGEIMPYDNQEAEINALHGIFRGAEAFQITARQPVATGSAVRRTIQLNFTVTSYAAVEQIIERITNCSYRCLVANVAITPYRNWDIDDETDNWVRCTIEVTFFETLVGAGTRAGLLIK